MESYKGRMAFPGERVDVYKNLHTGNFSIRSTKTKKVLCHAETVQLKDCVCHVNNKGREKTVSENRRRVHAWIRGTIVAIEPENQPALTNQIYYNPFKTDSFMDGGNPVTHLDHAFFVGKHVYRCSSDQEGQLGIEEFINL